MAKLKTVRLKQSEIDVLIARVSRRKHPELVAKLWQASKTSGEKIDDIEYARLAVRSPKYSAVVTSCD